MIKKEKIIIRYIKDFTRFKGEHLLSGNLHDNAQKTFTIRRRNGYVIPFLSEDEIKDLQHLLPGESLHEAYTRVVNSLGGYLSNNLMKSKTCDWEQGKIDKFVADKKEKWFKYLWNNWLCPATPVLANSGTNRGLPISCNILRMDDSIDSIWSKIHEMALLSKYGAGVGITMDKIRGAGESISSGGFSDGIVPFVKAVDSSIAAVSQSGIRRGYASINLPIRHRDIEDFIELREPTGDVNRICRNLQLCVTIDDYFMEDLENGKEKERDLWAKIITKRINSR